MIYLGIDLGTTFSLVAYVNDHGVPTLFPDFHDANNFRTPSVVHIGEGECLVGTTVEDILEDEPDLPHARFYKLSMGENTEAYSDHKNRIWWPQSLSALTLKKLLADVEAFASEEIGGVLITVPANFSDAQRRATREAAIMAGIKQIKLMDEPVAAATYYGFSEKQGEQTLFVYDLGGGTFDATILQASPDGLYALATAGNNRLGGKWVDEIIMEQVLEEFQRQHGIKPNDPASLQQVRRFAEECKLTLSKPGKGRVSKTLIIAGKTIDFVLTQDQFNQLVTQLVKETLEVCQQALDNAGLDWSMIDKVLLTGGSSLLPIVSHELSLASEIPKDALVCKQPHQAVAYGAAILANQVYNDSVSKKLQQICSHDLGIRAVDPKTKQPTVKVLIDRNSPVPKTERTTFYTTREDQSRMIIEAVQVHGSGESMQEKSLGFFAFGPIASPRKNYPIEIELGYDLDGIVTVKAVDEETGNEITQIMDQDTEALASELTEQINWIKEMRIN